MRSRRSRALVAAFAAICIASSVAAPLAVTDDLGRRVELKQPARRIVALAPFLTELAFSAGVGDRVVGASAFSDYPPPARGLPQVASSAGIAMEPLAALRPDLVLAWTDTTRPEDIARIERFGAAVFVARARRIEDVPRLLEALGRLAQADVAAPAREFRARIAALRDEYASRPRVTALVEVWHQPLTTVGGEHWIDEALGICGARNAFGDLPGVAPQVDLELVYRRDPQAIVGMGRPGEDAPFRARWQQRPALAAVREGHLAYVDADLVQRPTLRLPRGVAQLCEGIDRARR